MFICLYINIYRKHEGSERIAHYNFVIKVFKCFTYSANLPYNLFCINYNKNKKMYFDIYFKKKLEYYKIIGY